VAAVALLIAAAAIPAWWVQRSAAERWEELGVQSAASTNPDVRIAALQSLGKMTDVSDRGRAAVLEAMSDETPLIRNTAAIVAGEAGSDGSVYLTELRVLQRNDPDDGVRSAATVAIRQIETVPRSVGSSWPAVVALLIAVVGSAVWYFRIKRPGATKSAASPG
jgi:HEAT repeat protein